MKIIFAGGGTAGHINPALAIAKYCLSQDQNTEILFIGTEKGMEKELVPNSGFAIKFIDIMGFKRKINMDFFRQNIKSVSKILSAISECKKIIRDFKPDVVIGTGGYVSGPVVYAATRMKIPTIIHEQNVFPGLTSKILSGKVDTVAISFSESKPSFKSAKHLILSGNPIRQELFLVDKTQARQMLKCDDKPLIVAFGGSLGAEKLNKVIVDYIKSDESKKYSILFATGKIYYENVLKELNGVNTENVKLLPYIDNMDVVLNSADLVIARSGAITIAEITALGKASILIPSPNVTHNHQEYNARALEKYGATTVITEDGISGNVLNNAVEHILSSKKSLQIMESNAQKLGIKNATEIIYKEIMALK